MQHMWEHSTFISKSSGLTSTLCDLFLSSQSTHYFLYRKECLRSLGWESGSRMVVWSDLYGVERDCWQLKAQQLLSAVLGDKQLSVLYSWHHGILAWVAGWGRLGFFSNITLSLAHYFCYLAACLTLIHLVSFFFFFFFSIMFLDLRLLHGSWLLYAWFRALPWPTKSSFPS